MDISLTEEQEILKSSAKNFFENECPKSVIKDMRENDTGYPKELWQKMAELGWMGMIIPEEYGGVDGSFIDLVILLEEMGAACLPGPYFSTAVLGSLALLAGGNENQKREILPKIAEGSTIFSFALTEPESSYDASSIATHAKPDNDDYVINGTKLFVENAHIADHILCAARTSDGKEDGITLFLVEGKSAGIKCTLLKTIGYDKQCEVVFNNVKVPKKNILGELDKGWPIVEEIIEKAAVAKCADLVGVIQATLEMTVKYAIDREQFGRPIGSFQAIQHHCANMVTDVDASRFITYKAAWKIAEGLPATMESAMAKAWTSDASHRVTILGHQIHGAMGFCDEQDMHLYYRRAKAGELAFGDTDFNLKKVANELGF